MVQSTHPVSAEDTEVRSGLPPAHSCPFSVDKGLDWLPELKFIWNSMLLLLILCKTKYKGGKRPTKPLTHQTTIVYKESETVEVILT